MRKAIVLLAIALVVGGGLYYRALDDSGKTEKKENKDNKPVPVKVSQAQTRDMTEWVEAVGRGVASESVTVKPRVDGQVAAVPFTEGQHVKRGDLLIRLDPADLEAKLRQAEANQASSQAQLAKAKADLDRYTALKQSGFVSDEKVSEVRATLQAAEAGAQATKAATDLARLQLGYTAIRSPMDGIAGAKQVFPGSAVKINETPLVTINRVRPLHVSFPVPEKHLPRIRNAMAKGKLQAHVSIGGDWAHAIAAPVTFIDNTVDTGSGTIQLKATLDNQDEHFSPGQFLSIRLPVGQWPGATIVPAEAVQQGPQGSVVYVVKADNGIEIRKIVLADSQDGTAVVTQGLKADETVVVDGHMRLTPKSKVSVKEPGKDKDKGQPAPAKAP